LVDFLTSSHRVFSKLAAGAQAGKSSAWYGRIKRERKNDDLLAYMQQARHADEHGLEKIADASGGALQINPANYNAPLKVNDMVIEGGALKKLDAENASLKFVPADAILRPVKNRQGISTPIETP
jgi:hypothetical protein